jgi:DNA-binding MarR family transcriptional regulator
MSGPTTRERAAVRALSHRLFGGARYRVEVGAAISRRSRIANIRELADELGLAPQTISNELKRLEASGLLRRTDRHERKVYLVGAETSYWAFCEELEQRAARLLADVPHY